MAAKCAHVPCRVAGMFLDGTVQPCPSTGPPSDAHDAVLIVFAYIALTISGKDPGCAGGLHCLHLAQPLSQP